MLEQITTMIAPGGQGEVRAVISLDTFVLSEHEISVLDQVSFTGEQIDPNDFPGMIGYIVQPGDNLWSIAKKYRMSIERIREVNQNNKGICCVRIKCIKKWIRHSCKYNGSKK